MYKKELMCASISARAKMGVKLQRLEALSERTTAN